MQTPSRTRLRRKIEKLNRQLLTVGGLVEKNLHLAIRALEQRDPDVVTQVLQADRDIDRKEVELEEQCLEVLALHQPVAIDLRHIVAVLKINKDLERAGDLAVNIARIAFDLSTEPRIRISRDYLLMASKTQDMLRKSLDAFVNLSVEIARHVLAEDDEVDLMKHALHADFLERLAQGVDPLEPLVELFLVSRHLERIGDLATNVAEEVIYLVTGEIVRHGLKEPEERSAAKKARRMTLRERCRKLNRPIQ